MTCDRGLEANQGVFGASKGVCRFYRESERLARGSGGLARESEVPGWGMESQPEGQS